MAVLEVIEKQQLRANADRVGRYLRDGLEALAARHDRIGAIRGQGLFFGVEFVGGRDGTDPAPSQAARAVNGLRRRQVLTGLSGRHGNVLKLRPPLTFTTSHVNLLLSALDETLVED